MTAMQPSPEVRQAVAVTKPPDYHDRYREFLTVTDEKEVLAAALSTVLQPGTMLDIGAGGGQIPDLLRVDDTAYTAVECLPEFVEQLRHRGYRVIEDLFPCPVGGPYAN